MPFEEVRQALSPIADALDHLHGHTPPIVHGDVKPANLIRSASGKVVLVDFDIAAANATQRPLGTIGFVAPEVAAGDKPTPASDIYGLAAVLYECLAGSVLFDRDSEAALLYAHVEDAPEPLTVRRPDLPASIDDVLGRGLAKRPGDRYATAS